MSLSKKPAIVFVHGAWHRPLHYINLIAPLKAMGYTLVVPSLPTAGWGESVAEMTLADDVKTIHQGMTPHLEAGEDIVMVCHSYGGSPSD